jgi:hypothetical protein
MVVVSFGDVVLFEQRHENGVALVMRERRERVEIHTRHPPRLLGLRPPHFLTHDPSSLSPELAWCSIGFPEIRRMSVRSRLADSDG